MLLAKKQTHRTPHKTSPHPLIPSETHQHPPAMTRIHSEPPPSTISKISPEEVVPFSAILDMIYLCSLMVSPPQPLVVT